MKKLVSLIRQYPVASFFILTFTLSWGIDYLVDLIYSATESVIITLPFALLSAGPLVSALIITAVVGGKTGLVTLLRKFTVWRVSWRWYAIALFLLPGLALATTYLNVLLGAQTPSLAAFGSLSGLLGAFALRLVNPWDGPMLEELGWRGFAQTNVQKRYSPLTANLVLAVLITVWHFKYLPSGDYALIYIPATVASTILYGWVYNATGGSVLLTLIMHATEPLLWISFSAADESRAILIRVLIYVVTAVIVILLTGKNLGRKEIPISQTEIYPVVAST